MKELRILYHGLGMAGKTTNLEKLKEMFSDHIYDRFHQQTEEGRTVYLDVLVLKLRVKTNNDELFVSLFTTPGQKRFSTIRPWFFGHVDAIVFVLDSSRSLRENLEAFEEIRNLKIPIVVQANKRDSKNPIPFEEVERFFNMYTLVPAVAKEGIGVIDTFKEALKVAIDGRKALLPN